MFAGKSSLCVIALAMATLASMAGGADGGDVEKGKAKAAPCVACHGATGIGAHPAIPHLAGQHEAYLAARIKTFRRSPFVRAKPGEPPVRYDAVMGHVAAGMSDADAGDLAAYYASRPCVPEKLDKGEPAVAVAKPCVECHGAFGRSTNPLAPRLAGQQDTYIENQLKAFRGTGRGEPAGVVHRLRVHPVIGRSGTRLTDRDIDELAAYFADLSCR